MNVCMLSVKLNRNNVLRGHDVKINLLRKPSFVCAYV